MDGQIEKGPERIPTKQEVLQCVGHFTESPTVTRELADEQGLYLLEVDIPGPKPGEMTQYGYLRKGRFPNHNESSATEIQIVYYEDGVPTRRDNLAEYDYETGKFNEL